MDAICAGTLLGPIVASAFEFLLSGCGEDEIEWARLEQQCVPHTKYVHSHGVRHKAIEMEVLPRAAKKMRIRYLNEQLRCWLLYIDNPMCCGVPTPYHGFKMPYGNIGSILDEIELLKRPEEPVKSNAITEDMVVQAKAYPINQLLEFKFGKIQCINPTHVDNHPTMFYGNKTNRAICPACQAKYDSIDVLRITEGVQFDEAIKRLCNR